MGQNLTNNLVASHVHILHAVVEKYKVSINLQNSTIIHRPFLAFQIVYDEVSMLIGFIIIKK